MRRADVLLEWADRLRPGTASVQAALQTLHLRCRSGSFECSCDVVDCATRPHDTENTGITEDSSVNFDNTPFIILSVGTDAWAELSHYTGTCSDEEREPV